MSTPSTPGPPPSTPRRQGPQSRPARLRDFVSIIAPVRTPSSISRLPTDQQPTSREDTFAYGGSSTLISLASPQCRRPNKTFSCFDGLDEIATELASRADVTGRVQQLPQWRDARTVAGHIPELAVSSGNVG